MDMKTIFTVLVRMMLVTAGGALAQHGIINASGVDQFVSVGLSVAMILGGTCWSIWEKWGRPIAEAQLEIWKLKALARADALLRAGVPVPPPPTVAQVDAATPSSVTPAVAAKALDVMAKPVILLALILTGLLALPSSADAQGKPLNLIQDIARKNDVNAPGGAPGAQQPLGQSAEDFGEKLKALSLADLRYAAALADAAGNKITASCWHAWIDLIEKQNQQVKDKDGNVLTPPDPDLFTKVERVSQLKQSLQQGGAIQVGCAPLADAIKKDMTNLVGSFLGGGLGLAKLIPIIP